MDLDFSRQQTSIGGVVVVTCETSTCTFTMPEGPELHLAAKFITSIGQKTLFGGQVVKSEVSTKNPDVPWEKAEYRVQAVSRGKELKVLLTEGAEEVKGGETLSILFRFGMSGSFKYTPVAELPKHAHLQ